MTDAEQFFLACIVNGEITLTVDGLITHVNTGHSAWATGSGGYPKISKLDASVRKIRHIQCHRLMWLHFKGEIPVGFEVNHCDGIKQHYWLSNLELLTPLGNIKHAWDTGLSKPQSGVNNGFSKFTTEDVATIKLLHIQGEKITHIARRYSVSYPTVSDIIRGRRYADIPAAISI